MPTMQCSYLLLVCIVASLVTCVSGLYGKSNYYSIGTEHINLRAKRTEYSANPVPRGPDVSINSTDIGSPPYTVNNGEIYSQEYLVQSIPDRFFVTMEGTRTMTVNYSLRCNTSHDSFRITATPLSDDLFEIMGNSLFYIHCNSTHDMSVDLPNSPNQNHSTEFAKGTLDINIKGKLLAVAHLKIEAKRNFVSDVVLDTQLFVFVLRKIRTIDTVFRFLVGIVFFVIFIGFGCKLELDVVKECLRRPIAPGIGLGCQYVLMPLTGYGIASLLPIEDKSIRLGIFLCGVCPGGGASNIFTYVLGGDVSLSITMTFISTLASVGFMPLWIYTLGRTLMDEKISLTIPIVPLIQTVALATVPVFIGVFIKYKFLRAAKVIIKVLKPVTIVCILLFITIGIVSNMYIFVIFKPLYVLSGCLLPYTGYLLGGITAAVLGQPWTRVKTIALETGMQNVGVAFILLLISFPPPLGDIATVAPAANGMMTPIPVFLISIPYLIYTRYKKTYDPVETSEETYKEKEKPDGHAVAIENLSSV